MAKKLFVGNIPYQANDDELREHFSPAGEVTSAIIIMDKMTGRSKGFGFVEMATDEMAQEAINSFNGRDFNGKTLVVNEARPFEPRAPRDGGFQRRNSFQR